MTWHKPSPPDVLKAIEVYVSVAYDATLPSAVRSRIETLKSLAVEEFFQSPIFERDVPIHPKRLAVRLGNRAYPHMKLVIERSPDGASHLFRADTHDRHVCPEPGSRDYAAFKQLMEANQVISSSVEAAWADQHLPTFKTYLRDDLAKRAGGPA